MPAGTPLWYAHYQMPPQANFDDFAPFGSWTKPEMKQCVVGATDTRFLSTLPFCDSESGGQEDFPVFGGGAPPPVFVYIRITHLVFGVNMGP